MEVKIKVGFIIAIGVLALVCGVVLGGCFFG